MLAHGCVVHRHFIVLVDTNHTSEGCENVAFEAAAHFIENHEITPTQKYMYIFLEYIRNHYCSANIHEQS